MLAALCTEAIQVKLGQGTDILHLLWLEVTSGADSKHRQEYSPSSH